MILEVAPTRWYSSDFTVREDSRRVAKVKNSCWCEKGALTIDRTHYRMYREGWLSGGFRLEREGAVLARAERPSAFRRKYLVRYRDREYTLAARSVFRRAFVLSDGSEEIGSIEHTTAFTHAARADLPDAWPLPVRAFVIWLTIMQWRRESGAAAGC